MSGAGVNEGGERVGDEIGSEGDMEGVGVGKSGRVETDNLGIGTRRVNAVLSMCGGLRTAQTFFGSGVSFSLACTARALALEAEDEDFGQLLAV
jgi:hypothetical protein